MYAEENLNPKELKQFNKNYNVLVDLAGNLISEQSTEMDKEKSGECLSNILENETSNEYLIMMYSRVKSESPIPFAIGDIFDFTAEDFLKVKTKYGLNPSKVYLRSLLLSEFFYRINTYTDAICKTVEGKKSENYFEQIENLTTGLNDGELYHAKRDLIENFFNKSDETEPTPKEKVVFEKVAQVLDHRPEKIGNEVFSI